MSALCPVRCGMHWRAGIWLDEGRIEFLQEFAPVFDRMRATNWLHCTCDMYARVQAALAPARA